MYQNLEITDRIARKEHSCDWCNGTIQKGEKYNYQRFLFDGEFCEWRAHLKCQKAMSAIWDYVNPDEGMNAWEFDEGCADVCRTFICPDCEHWGKEYYECEKDESYCIDKIAEFFETHELYCERAGLRCQVWKCREIPYQEDET